MGSRRGEFGSGGSASDGDLEFLRERLLDHPDDMVSSESHGNSVNNYGIGRTSSLVLGILCGLSIGVSAFSIWQGTKSERETRMLEYYLLELDAKVIKAGIKEPDDSIAEKLKEKP